MWNHWAPAPYLLGALVVLLAFRVLTWRTATVTFGAVLVGALPLLIDNVRAAAGDRSVSVYLALSSAGPTAPLPVRIAHGGFSGLPGALGLCEVGRCAWWAQLWAPVFVGLLVVATVLAVIGLTRRRPAERPGPMDRGRADRPARAARPAVGPRRRRAGQPRHLPPKPRLGGEPMGTARYLALLVLSVPAVIWPAWEVARRGRGRLGRVPVVVLGAALALTMSAATVSLARAVPHYQNLAARRAALVTALDQAGLTYIHADYWTCYWVAYRTGERIQCGVLANDGDKGHNRYWPALARRATGVRGPGQLAVGRHAGRAGRADRADGGGRLCDLSERGPDPYLTGEAAPMTRRSATGRYPRRW